MHPAKPSFNLSVVGVTGANNFQNSAKTFISTTGGVAILSVHLPPCLLQAAKDIRPLSLFKKI